MPLETPRFRKWQAAELAAQAVERSIREQIDAAAADGGHAEIGDELAFASELRRHAHRLFLEAMEELDDVVSSLNHRALIAGRPGERNGRGRDAGS